MTQTAPSGPLSAGTGAPGRARITLRTLRTDRWWIQPAITAGVLFSFVIYATWRAFENAYYYASPYLSPFYSPCVSGELRARVRTTSGAWSVTGTRSRPPC